MLSDVMNYFGLKRVFQRAGFFETEQQTALFKELKPLIRQGGLIAISGIVGCGKTTALQRLQLELAQEKNILVSCSQTVEKERVSLGTLMTALFADLKTEKDSKLPKETEQRERRLLAVILKGRKPVALFIDEAHDLQSKTLVGLKRLIELVHHNGGTLCVVLAGHPKLKNDLRRPTLEEIGARASVFTLEGIQGHQSQYIKWLLSECIQDKLQPEDLLTEAAIAFLAERLVTPLQVEHYLRLILEEAYRVGLKPATPEVIETVLAAGINDLEPRLIRQGYDAKVLANLLNVRTAEVRSLLQGQLPPGRTQELKDQILKLGISV